MLSDIIQERNIPPFPEAEDRDERFEIIKKTVISEEYGEPVPKPDRLSFEKQCLENDYFLAGKAVIEEVTVTAHLLGQEFCFPFKFIHPIDKKNQKVVVQINFGSECPHKFTPVEEIVDLGFSLAAFDYKDVTSDDGDFTNGIAGILFPDGKRISPLATGKIMMWSWAASRVMDYLETLDFVDLNNVTVTGHSRLGKTAILTGVLDTRFKFVHSNNSGCGGGAIFRKKRGENIEAITNRFPYWFCPKFATYRGKESELPFDQHWLVGAIAPRYIQIATAFEDVWADHESEYLTCVAASEEFEKSGVMGFVHPDRMPELYEYMNEGHIGYYVREGRHFFSRYDWQKLAEFVNMKIGENK